MLHFINSQNRILTTVTEVLSSIRTSFQRHQSM